MTLPRIDSIQRLSFLLLGLATLASLIFWDIRVISGVLAGGGLAALNFYALKRLVQAIVQGDNPRKQAVLVILLTLKFGILAACIYLVIKFLPINPLALLAGISLVVLAIFIEGFRSMLSGAAPQSE